MGPFGRAQTIWETRTGPFEVVSFGDVELTPQAMAGAIYAFDPTLPPKPNTADKAILAERAFELVSSGDYGAALAIVTSLDKANFLDDSMIRAAAYSILMDGIGVVQSNRLPDMGKFSDKLTPEQRKLLNDEIIRILTTPTKGRHRAFLFKSKELGQRAVDTFKHVPELELWQYQGLLTAMIYVATPSQDYRQELFASIMASHDPSNGRRIVAYLDRAGLSDEEMRALTPKLAEIDGEDIFSIAMYSLYLPSPSRARKLNSTFDPEVAVKGETWSAFWVAMR